VKDISFLSRIFFGVKKVHLLYVDESGDDGFPHSGTFSNNTGQSKVFIRTGLIIHDRHWARLNEEVLNFKFKYRIPKSVELHATEILRGSEKYYSRSAGKKKTRPNWFGQNFPNKADRVKLLEKCCKLISSRDDITLICVVIDKQKINCTMGDYKNLPKNNSWEFLIERYNMFLDRATDRIGIIISDAIQDKIEKTHRDFAKAIYDQSTHIDKNHFIESILFEPSDSSNLLQLADIASYAFYRKFNTQDETFYNHLESKLLCSADGKLDGAGLKIWPV
jgi:hypothetical protein